MKLLLDENLSRRLVPFLLTAYPGSTQVVLVGLEAADDTQVWQYAKTNDFVIVTQDAAIATILLRFAVNEFWSPFGDAPQGITRPIKVEGLGKASDSGMRNV